MAEQLLIWPLRTGAVPRELVGRTFAPAEALAHEALGEYARLQSSALVPRVLREGFLHLYLGTGRWAHCTVLKDGLLGGLEGSLEGTGLALANQSGAQTSSSSAFISLSDKTTLEKIYLLFFPTKLSDSKLSEMAAILDGLAELEGSATDTAKDETERVRQQYLKSLEDEARAVQTWLTNELKLEDKRFRDQMEKLETARRTADDLYRKRAQQLDFEERQALNSLNAPMSVPLPVSGTSQLAEYYKVVQQQAATPGQSPGELTSKTFDQERVKQRAWLQNQERRYQESKSALIAENSKRITDLKRDASFQLTALSKAQLDVLEAKKSDLDEEHANRRQLLQSKAAAFAMIDIARIRRDPSEWQPCIRRARSVASLVFDALVGSSGEYELLFPLRTQLSRVCTSKLDEVEKVGQTASNALQGGGVICLPDPIGATEELSDFRVSAFQSVADWADRIGMGGKLTNGELVDLYHQVIGLRSLVRDSLARMTAVQTLDAFRTAVSDAERRIISDMTGLSLGMHAGISNTPFALWDEVERRMPGLSKFGQEMRETVSVANGLGEARAFDQLLLQRSSAFLKTVDLLDSNVFADRAYYCTCILDLIEGLDHSHAGSYYLEKQLRDLVAESSDGGLLERMLCFGDAGAGAELKQAISTLNDRVDYLANVAHGIKVLRKTHKLSEVADSLERAVRDGLPNAGKGRRLALAAATGHATLTRWIFNRGLRQKLGKVEAMVTAILSWPSAKLVELEVKRLSQLGLNTSEELERWLEGGFAKRCIEDARYSVAAGGAARDYYRVRVAAAGMMLDAMYLLHLMSRDDASDQVRLQIAGRASSFSSGALKSVAAVIESARWTPEVYAATSEFRRTRAALRGGAAALGVVSNVFGLMASDDCLDQTLYMVGIPVDVLKGLGEMKILKVVPAELSWLVRLGASPQVLYASWFVTATFLVREVPEILRGLMATTKSVIFLTVKLEEMREWAEKSSFGGSKFDGFREEVSGLNECIEAVP